MTHLLDVAVAGLSAGVIYSLVALGFTMIFKSTGVLNFAHGSLLLFGAYVTAQASTVFNFWIAFVLGALAAASVAILLDRVIFRWLDSGDHISLAVITLGIDLVILGELTRHIGTRVLTTNDPWGDAVLSIGSVSLPASRFAAIVAAGGIMAVFFLLLRFTNWGIAMRASTQDTEAAALVGIRPWRVSVSAWAVGGLLAAIAGVFVTTFPTPGVTTGAAGFALKAFPAAVLGGLDSLGGAVVGGLALGMVEAVFIGYGTELGFLGSGFITVVPYAVLVIVLLVRPSGLFGSRQVNRV